MRQTRRSRPRARLFPGLGRLALVLVVLIAWTTGLWRFAQTLPREAADLSQPAEVIVVLTGGSRRVAEGVALLMAGAAPRLFISGVPRGVRVADLTLGQPLAPTLVECCITLGHAAEDTIGNAAEIAGYMAAGGYRTLRLVTADYHMPRAMAEVRRAVPDVHVLPHPVFPEGFRRGDWWRWPGTLALIAVEYSKGLVVSTRHAIADLVTGEPK